MKSAREHDALYWAIGGPLVVPAEKHQLYVVPPAYAALYDLVAQHCWPWHRVSGPRRAITGVPATVNKGTSEARRHSHAEITVALTGACAGLPELSGEAVQQLVRGRLIAPPWAWLSPEERACATDCAVVESERRPVCALQMQLSSDRARVNGDSGSGAKGARAPGRTFDERRTEFLRKFDALPVSDLLKAFMKETPNRRVTRLLALVCGSSPQEWVEAVEGATYEPTEEEERDRREFHERPIERFFGRGGAIGAYINRREHSLSQYDDLWVVSAVGFLNEAQSGPLAKRLEGYLRNPLESPRYIFGVAKGGANPKDLLESADAVRAHINSLHGDPPPHVSAHQSATEFDPRRQTPFVEVPPECWRTFITTYGTMIMVATFADAWWYARRWDRLISLEAFVRHDPTGTRNPERDVVWSPLEGPFAEQMARELYGLDEGLLASPVTPP